MKIKFNKKQLEKHLDNISRALAQHPILYALKGIYITAKEDTVEFIASDGNLSIKEIVEQDANMKIIEPGECLIMGTIFKNIIKKQTGEIFLKVNDNNITITTEDSEIEMNLLTVDDYPHIDFSLIGQKATMKAEDFKKLVNDVSFAAAENDKRVILNGVNLKVVKKRLIVSATNSYRIAMGNMPIKIDGNFNITIIARNLKQFLPSDVKENVEIIIGDSKINMKNGSTIIQSKLIDTVYPELNGLIPHEYQSTIKIESEIISKLVEKAIVISSSQMVTIRLEVNKEVLSLESRKEQIGNSRVETKKFQYDGNPFDISFDAGFFKDALKTLSGEIEIHFVGSLKPIIINSKEKENLIHLILPHRTY